jgi:ADP-ribosylglycohydrolase/protein-tyrosine phosphatase
MTIRNSVNSPLVIDAVAVGAGQVGMTLCPGKKAASLSGFQWDRDLALDAAAIREWGARAVVTLIEDHEFRELDVEQLPEVFRGAGLEWHHLPIRDVDVPGGRFEMRWQYAGARLRERLRSGERVLVHCKGGLGRAGTVAARLLVEFGVDPAQAIARVREARTGAIETRGQERWVHQQSSVDAAKDVARGRRLACLLGGAIGDAVGYRVEFKRWPEIEREYGPAGIRLAACDGPLVVSDDTQMTLFTLEGMTRAATSDQITAEIREAYLDWLGTQRRDAGRRPPRGHLAHEPVLQHARAPGNACLAALSLGGEGTVEQPINDRKGCGGVMRTAPLGFLSDAVSDENVFRLAVEAAALTHGHADGYLPAGTIAVLIRDALQGVLWDESVAKVLALVRAWPRSDPTVAAIAAAAEAAGSGVPSRAKVAALGEGWVGEEALAVGLYCAMTARSFAECIEVAANHDGDSDSTASVAGQLYGARHGLAVIPAEAVDRVDVLEALLQVVEAWEGRGRSARQ